MKKIFAVMLTFHDGGPPLIGTRPLTCSADHWTGFFIKGSSVMKEITLRSFFTITLRSIIITFFVSF